MSYKPHWKGCPPMTQVVGVEGRDGGKGMAPGIAVFNLHVNDAGRRADAEFKRLYGERKFNRVIKPLHDAGIMSIFHGGDSSVYRHAWVAMVSAFVNERAQPKRKAARRG